MSDCHGPYCEVDGTCDYCKSIKSLNKMRAELADAQKERDRSRECSAAYARNEDERLEEREKLLRDQDELIVAAQELLDWFAPKCLKYEMSDCADKRHPPCKTCKLQLIIERIEKEKII